jgi:AbiJ N-terminal domain 4
MDQSFSQRMGLKPIKDIIQLNDMDGALKNSLWNCWYIDIFGKLKSTHLDFVTLFFSNIWMGYFKRPIDEMPTIGTPNDYPHIVGDFREYFYLCKWYEAYDFIQFSADVFPFPDHINYFIQSCNTVLSRELSGYRFVDNKLVPITSEHEIAEIETAISVSTQYTQHLGKALNLLADRKSPDYVNSIKESISAVEATCRLLIGDSTATLGKGLDRLISKNGILKTDNLKNNLKEAFKNLYSYTSDAQGIRHGLVGQANIDVEDARFMLIACSAFINYLTTKANKESQID